MSLQLSPEAASLLLAKAAGAAAGSAVSVAYILPRGRREAALRFFAGFAVGMVFGASAGVKLAAMLGISGELSRVEITMSGAAAASLCAWWALGVLSRIAQRLPGRIDPAPADTNGSNDNTRNG
jgi:hypothetical protein